MKRIKNLSLKTLLFGEQSIFYSFIGKELQEITAGLVAMLYLPIFLVFQVYLGIEIYDAYIAKLSYLRPTIMFLLVGALELLYILYVLKLRRKKAKIIKIEKAAQALPQIILQTWLTEINKERVRFKNN